MNPSKKTLEPHCERSEPTVETDHEQRPADRWLALSGSQDITQLIFIQAQRLFAENVLTGLKGCQHLSRVEMMSSSDNNSVDRRIVGQAVFIGCTVAKSELLRGVMRMG